MNIWKRFFGGGSKPSTPASRTSPQPALPSTSASKPPTTPAPASPPSAPVTKLRIPKPTRIYVAGQNFLPDDDQQIFGVQGFFSRHDNLEPDVPRGAVWQGVMAFGSDAPSFCDYARSVIFGNLYGSHPGAYYLDAILLVPGGKNMMVVIIWEGNEAKAARERIPGGTNL